MHNLRPNIYLIQLQKGTLFMMQTMTSFTWCPLNSSPKIYTQFSILFSYFNPFFQPLTISIYWWSPMLNDQDFLYTGSKWYEILYNLREFLVILVVRWKVLTLQSFQNQLLNQLPKSTSKINFCESFMVWKPRQGVVLNPLTVSIWTLNL